MSGPEELLRRLDENRRTYLDLIATRTDHIDYLIQNWL
jgi:hypothetical protein